MVRDKKEKEFELHSDFLDTYIDSGVGVIHLKDKVYEMGIDFSMASVLFDKLSLAADSEEVIVVLVISNPSVLGEEKLDQFWEKILALRNGTAKGDFLGVTDPVTAISRQENSLNQFITTVLCHEKLVISAVRGSVVTTFFGAILASDYIIASEDTVFSFPHFRYEFPPRGAIAYFLPRYVGYPKAKEILMSGKPITAREAEELHLVDRVIPNTSFEEQCLEIARGFTEKPAKVMAMTKKLLASNMHELVTHLKCEAELINVYQVAKPRC